MSGTFFADVVQLPQDFMQGQGQVNAVASYSCVLATRNPGCPLLRREFFQLRHKAINAKRDPVLKRMRASPTELLGQCRSTMCHSHVLSVIRGYSKLAGR